MRVRSLSAVRIGERMLGGAYGVKAPERRSFEEFLLRDARAPAGRGLYSPYSFAGREALQAVVRTIDLILGAPPPGATPLGAGDPARVGPRRRLAPSVLSDAEVCLAGGAQFGKTILELNLAAYLTGRQFRNFGLYLPDDDLVEGIVDAKFRPDVVDQIDWFATMTQVGKALNKSGKAVNRKGAFLVADGDRKAVGLIRGLGKVPTTFSMDAAALDEVDDIEPRMMKFVRGRLTASDLRLLLKIGTQRIHGRGMHQAWKEGSQGVFILVCPACGRRHNPEEEFPGIVRLRGEGRTVPEADVNGIGVSRTPFGEPRTHVCGHDFRLTWAGDFRAAAGTGGRDALGHDPGNRYYLGCVDCGAELDRRQPRVEHRQPAQIQQRKWSFRISQLGIAAIELAPLVGRFQAAVADPEEMAVFRCDVLGLPRCPCQALTPAVLERARTVETFELSARVGAGRVAYGGLDMGDRCWLFARESRLGEGGAVAGQRLLAAERIPAADVVAQAQRLFFQLGLAALLVDERPLVNEARALALSLNGLQDLSVWPRLPPERAAYLTLPGGLTWDGRNARWLKLKCAVVRFTKNQLGAGIEQGLVCFEEGGQTKFVPCIACNRFETIDRVVRELLTPAEGVLEIVAPARGETAGAPRDGMAGVRRAPAMLLPTMGPGHPPILDLLEAHLVAGSERGREADGALGDYVAGGENHLLLADGYSALAAIVCGGESSRANPAPGFVCEGTSRSQAMALKSDRGLAG